MTIRIIEKLLGLGFLVRVVLADSLYGESGPFISALHRLGPRYVVPLHSNHGFWMLSDQCIRHTRLKRRPRVSTVDDHLWDIIGMSLGSCPLTSQATT